MSIQSEINRISGNVNSALSAIADKGVSVPSGANSDDLAELIAQVETGIDTSDATAAAGDILSGKTAYVNGEKVAGTIESQAAQTITPGTADKTIDAGKYLAGTQTIKGDANLIANNIKSGVNIFGIAGAFTGGAAIKTGTFTPTALNLGANPVSVNGLGGKPKMLFILLNDTSGDYNVSGSNRYLIAIAYVNSAVYSAAARMSSSRMYFMTNSSYFTLTLNNGGFTISSSSNGSIAEATYRYFAIM